MNFNKEYIQEEAENFFTDFYTDFFGFRNASYVQEGIFYHGNVPFPFIYDYGRGKFKLYDPDSNEIIDWTLKKIAIKQILNGDIYPDYSVLYERYPVPESKQLPVVSANTAFIKVVPALGWLTFNSDNNGKLWLEDTYESSFGTIRNLPKWLTRDPDFRAAMWNVPSYKIIKAV